MQYLYTLAHLCILLYNTLYHPCIFLYITQFLFTPHISVYYCIPPTSPLISMTNRSTPCAAGCWGPKFIVRLVTVFPGTGSMGRASQGGQEGRGRTGRERASQGGQEGRGRTGRDKWER